MLNQRLRKIENQNPALVLTKGRPHKCDFGIETKIVVPINAATGVRRSHAEVNDLNTPRARLGQIAPSAKSTPPGLMHPILSQFDLFTVHVSNLGTAQIGYAMRVRECGRRARAEMRKVKVRGRRRRPAMRSQRI